LDARPARNTMTRRSGSPACAVFDNPAASGDSCPAAPPGCRSADGNRIEPACYDEVHGSPPFCPGDCVRSLPL